ncbi:MAG: hypothetical protein ACYTEZ_20205 [Planctomycetota bacterium]|jgi:hypothetical protein
MRFRTASLTDGREWTCGLASVVYLVLPVALFLAPELVSLLRGPPVNLGARLVSMLVVAGLLEGVLLFIVACYYLMTLAVCTPRAPWPLRPDLLFTAVRRLTVSDEEILLTVGCVPFRRRRRRRRARCEALRVASRPEGRLVGSARRRFALELLVDGDATVLVRSYREDWLRRAAAEVGDLTALALRDESYGRVREAPLPRPAPREPAALPGLSHDGVGTDREAATWSGRHELTAGLLFLGLVLALYGLLLVLGVAGPFTEPGWVDLVVFLLFVGGLWHGVVRRLLVHRLALDGREIVYTLSLLGLRLWRRRLRLAEVDAVRLGFEEATLESLAPEAREAVDRQRPEAMVDRLLERRLVIAGRQGSIRVKGLPGAPARAFKELAETWVDGARGTEA